MASAAAILDVDGTLVDTNYQHALAWYRAFRQHEVVLPMWRIHRHIGMGGDQLVSALCGDEVERRIGDAIREEEGERYMELIDEVRPFDGARRLIDVLREGGHAVVLASSAKSHEVDHYLALLGALRLNGDLSTAARRHSRAMVSKRFFSHTSPDGTTFLDRIKATGYLSGARSWNVGENIAYGSGSLSTPRAISRAWMKSPGHRANILSSAFRSIGVGIASGTPVGRDGGTYTTDFGRRS